VLFVIDTHREITAIKEANTLNIRHCDGDTNCDPDPIDLAIPAKRCDPPIN